MRTSVSVTEQIIAAKFIMGHKQDHQETGCVQNVERARIPSEGGLLTPRESLSKLERLYKHIGMEICYLIVKFNLLLSRDPDLHELMLIYDAFLLSMRAIKWHVRRNASLSNASIFNGSLADTKILPNRRPRYFVNSSSLQLIL